MKIKKIGLMIMTLFFAIHGISQNNNVVSAALEYQKYETEFYGQNFNKAKEHLIEAKKFIDPAMTHESTKMDAKAHYYNVMINFGLLEISGIDESNELEAFTKNPDSIINVISSSIEIAGTKRRWKGETDDFFNKKIIQSVSMGEMMFEAKNFELSFYAFAGAYQVKKIAKLEEERINRMKTNAIIAARNYIDTLEKTGETETALEFVSKGLEVIPGSEDLAIAGVNLALANNDLETAEEFFNVAAEAAPDNKVLFSNMGSIYLTVADKAYNEFVQMNISDEGYEEKSEEVEYLYAKAETHLKKALEIDGEYAEAAYNLGVLYLGRADKLRTTASQMDLNDQNYNKTMMESQEMYKKAIEPLEIYIATDPHNVGVLNVLFQVHRNAGNDDKAMEYRKRAQEAEAGQGAE